MALSFNGISQEKKLDLYEPGNRAQSFYVEVGGPGFISANYDFRFKNTRNAWGLRGGIGYFSVDGDSFLSIPIQVNYLLGKKGHYFEMGAGASYIRNSEYQYIYNVSQYGQYEYSHEEKTSENQVLGSFTFGYRKQPVDGGFNFRVGLSPIFYDGDFIPYLPYLVSSIKKCNKG